MTWFKHRHYWREKTINMIRPEGAERANGGLIVEDCQCGAVRTIEYHPGESPIVRVAKEGEGG